MKRPSTIGLPGSRGARAARLAGALLVVLAGIALAGGSPAPARAVDAPPLDLPGMLHRESAHLDSLLHPQSTQFDSAGLGALADSLDRGGVEAIRHHRPGQYAPPRLETALRPGALSAYNRIEGPRYGLGGTLRYGRRLGLDVAAAYGGKSHRWSGEGTLGLGRRLRGPRLEIAFGEAVRPFGPDAEVSASALVNLLAGQDRQDFLRRRELRVSLWPVRRRDVDLGVAFFTRQETPEAARTDYSLIQADGRPIEAPNPTVDHAATRGVEFQLHRQLRQDLVRLTARAGIGGGALGGEADWNWQMAGAELRPVFPDGGVLMLRGTAWHVGGRPAAQDAAYLGGDATLRGYPRLGLAGREVVALRAEYALGLDLFERARIPGLRRLHLQFIPFLDAGSTWGSTHAVAGAAGPLDGTLRSSVGLGLKRALWLPGAEAVRLDIIHRNDGGGDPWSFWFRFVTIE